MAKKELDRFDTHAKRDVQIRTKLLIYVGLAIVVCCAGVAALSIAVFDRGYLDEIQNELVYTMDGCLMILDDRKGEGKEIADLAAGDLNVVNFYEQNDRTSLAIFANNVDSGSSIDVFCFTDAYGKIIASSDMEFPSGVELSGVHAVASALKGTSMYSCEPAAGCKYGVICASPVKVGSRVVGAAVAVYDLASEDDDDFLDKLKKSYHVECTVFSGDIRMGTTLRNDKGQTLAGTRLDNKNIVDTVLNKGAEYKGRNTIQGINYLTVYYPISRGEGSVNGMLFVAKSLSSVNEIKSFSIKTIVPVTIILAIIVMIVVGRFIFWLMWRINNVTKVCKELSAGDAVVYADSGGTVHLGRICAAGGDTVNITENGLTVNGYFREEPYASGSTVLVEGMGAAFPLTLSEGEYFILCDDRTDVNDSRLYGAVGEDDIKGKVLTLIRHRDF